MNDSAETRDAIMSRGYLFGGIVHPWRWVVSIAFALATDCFQGIDANAQAPAPLREVLVEVEGDRQQRGPLPQQNLFTPTAESLDQWVFNLPAEEASKNFDQLVQMEIERIDQICRLSPEQSQLLQLAGESEKQRIRRQLQLLHAKYADRQYEQHRVGAIYQNVKQLQSRVHRRPLSASSMLLRLLTSILDDEQAARWTAWEQDRQRARLRREISKAVARIDQHVPLRSEQRNALIRLLEAEVQLVAQPQDAENVVVAQMMTEAVLAQMNGVAPESFQAFLEPPQWEAMQEVFTPHRGQFQLLQQRRLLMERKEGER